MTPAEHIQRVRQVAFQLERADYGLGMPRDYDWVLVLRTLLAAAEKEAVTAIHDAFIRGSLKFLDAVVMLESIGEDEPERVVDEWADNAEAEANAERFSESQGGY